VCSRLGVDLSGGSWEEEQEEEDGSNPFAGVVAARVRGREWWQSLRFERLTDCVVSVRKMEEGEVEELSLTFNVTVDSTVWGNGGGGRIFAFPRSQDLLQRQPYFISPFISLSFFSFSLLLLSRSAVVVLRSY
jgi:hypothetical protein